MDNLLYYSQFLRPGLFTDDDRRACLSVVGYFYDTAMLTRQKGLFVIESLIEDTDDEFLKIALQMVADRCPAETMSEVLLTFILFSSRKGAELLRGILIAEGVCCVARAENPVFLRTKLLAYLGADFYAEACRTLDVDPIYS